MTGEARPRIATGRLWAGGGATALVAALTAVVVFVVAHGIFGVPVLAPVERGVWDSIGAAVYAGGAAAAALAATALLHLLLICTPRAMSFFTGITLLLTAIAVVVPVSLDADSGTRLVTAAGNLFVGLVITGTLSGVARAAVRAPG